MSNCLNLDSHSYKVKPLVDILFQRIFPLGVTQCVRTATRYWPGQQPSGLDHLYTTNPAKLSDVHTVCQGGSDHRLIIATRQSKTIRRSQRIVRKRCFKNFNKEAFIKALQSTKWWDIYSSDDVHEASTLLTNKLTYILDTLAPIKTFQVRKSYCA